MSDITHLNDANFDETINNAKLPILVDFYADWCGPCKALEPAVIRLASELEETLQVYKIDTDANPGIAGKYNIMSIPCLMIFQNGQVVAQKVGLQSFTSLKQWVQDRIA